MTDNTDEEYALRLSYLEQTDPNSLAVARLYLEMASNHPPEEREAALKLFDAADEIFSFHLPTARDAAVAGLALSLNNRAALEIEAGEWDWAVDAACQANELRQDRLRNCVGRRDDSERLDLGYSLAALVLALQGAGKLDLARDAASDAVEVLGTFAGMRNQDAFILLTKLICIYADLCSRTDQLPNAGVLLPLAKAFYGARGKP
ncbi:MULTISPECIES: hypothetical protein [Thalassospira]|uniref:Tetratrico peptide repeat group 5 domain-containing protein n=1 Tax=Thalassospira profundimaris TaxID=502049 RepID=A0A367VFF7_9PROT|nr:MULTISPECIES: hypothetical protein [Thalassospira]KZB73628.1 hypothetical protein AUQ43_00360 [Thalassospira sp. MCCC 1A01148]RCK23916.1 hypothetical protein TH6_04130 [Thalassospira profundimaris]